MGADVIFHAAGASGFGVFSAAAGQSDEQGRHLWAIGVDNDQWFQVDSDQRAHLLTSMIKRGDIASYLVTRQFLAGDFTPGPQEIGMADDAFDFSTQGNGLTASMVAELESLKAGIANGRITVPAEPSGELLDLDPLPTTSTTCSPTCRQTRSPTTSTTGSSRTTAPTPRLNACPQAPSAGAGSS